MGYSRVIQGFLPPVEVVCCIAMNFVHTLMAVQIVIKIMSYCLKLRGWKRLFCHPRDVRIGNVVLLLASVVEIVLAVV